MIILLDEVSLYTTPSDLSNLSNAPATAEKSLLPSKMVASAIVSHFHALNLLEVTPPRVTTQLHY